LLRFARALHLQSLLCKTCYVALDGLVARDGCDGHGVPWALNVNVEPLYWAFPHGLLMRLSWSRFRSGQ